MPHPKGHVKLTGDTHLPDAESDLEVEQGTTGLAALAHERGRQGRANGGVRKAGLLHEDDQGAAPRAAPATATAQPHRVARHRLAANDDAIWRTATRWGLGFLALCLVARALRR